MTENSAGQKRLYLEDLEIGRRFETGSVLVERDAIKRFAAEFDPQPFHLDEHAAEGTFFGGLVASGWHTAAMTMRLLVTSGLPIAGGVIGAGGELVWPMPVYPDDELTVGVEVVASKRSASRPDRGLVTVRTETPQSEGRGGRRS